MRPCAGLMTRRFVFEYLINLILVSQPNIELLVLPNLEPILSIHGLFLDFDSIWLRAAVRCPLFTLVVKVSLVCVAARLKNLLDQLNTKYVVVT